MFPTTTRREWKVFFPDRRNASPRHQPDVLRPARYADLESHGISLGVADGGDFTRISGSCTTPELEHALDRMKQMMQAPSFPQAEFARLKEQTVNRLRIAQDSPRAVASGRISATRSTATRRFGRIATPASVEAITLDAVKQCYPRNLVKNDSVSDPRRRHQRRSRPAACGPASRGWTRRMAKRPRPSLCRATPHRSAASSSSIGQAGAGDHSYGKPRIRYPQP